MIKTRSKQGYSVLDDFSFTRHIIKSIGNTKTLTLYLEVNRVEKTCSLVYTIIVYY